MKSVGAEDCTPCHFIISFSSLSPPQNLSPLVDRFLLARSNRFLLLRKRSLELFNIYLETNSASIFMELAANFGLNWWISLRKLLLWVL
jgi:hypothetical protein